MLSIFASCLRDAVVTRLPVATPARGRARAIVHLVVAAAAQVS